MSIEAMPSIKEIERQVQLSRIQLWSSRFGFLNITNGIRPSKVSYILGTTGTGKSTLVTSIVADCAKEGKVLVILSEEPPIDYSKTLFVANGYKTSENIFLVNEKLMPENIKTDQDMVWAWIERYITESCVKIVIWDNLTSSPFFSQRYGVEGQEAAIQKIRAFAELNNVAFFIVMHTAKAVTDNMGRLIEGEDVKGTAHSFIAADHFYIFQRFAVSNVFYPFVRVVKHRGYNPEHKVFLLQFSNGIYIKDAPSSFEEMNEVFLKRNVLGKSRDNKGRRND